ncbi:MAG: tRNA pseudouridine(13) synthase TruD [Candidatus Obscuribacterales bacterium]|nr:tRNA pseudouridine(13) synthase TruD [Candidatus Obscuribacterales bacterium]
MKDKQMSQQLNNYDDARQFCPLSAREYLGANLGLGGLKERRSDFKVTEIIPGRPGRYLTLSRESDFEPDDLVFHEKHDRVWCTLVKHGLTFPGARNGLHKLLCEKLKRNNFFIKGTGLKDRRAHTAQLLEIRGVTADELRRINWPLTPEMEARDGVGFYIKDVRPVLCEIRNGSHGLNHFEIKVRLKGQSKAEIEAYLKPRFEKLQRMGGWFPNFYGNQRLGGRQMQHLVGQTAICGAGYQSPPGEPNFSSNVEAAMHRFICATSPAEKPEVSRVREACRKRWLFDFEGMADLLGGCYKKFNLDIEFEIARRLADNDRYRGDFNQIFLDMSDDTSLWVSAWQSWWWNHVVASELPGWIAQIEAGKGFRPNDVRVPLIMDTPAARSFYGQRDYCKQALTELDQAEKAVHDLFLIPLMREDRGGRFRPKNGPERRVFTQAERMSYTVSDGAVDFVFDLRSGVYATTFLGLFWNMSQDHQEEESENEAGARRHHGGGYQHHGGGRNGHHRGGRHNHGGGNRRRGGDNRPSA